MISKVKISTEINAIRSYHDLNVYIGKFYLRFMKKLVNGLLFNSTQRHTHDKKQYLRSKNSCISQELCISL